MPKLWARNPIGVTRGFENSYQQLLGFSLPKGWPLTSYLRLPLWFNPKKTTLSMRTQKASRRNLVDRIWLVRHEFELRTLWVGINVAIHVHQPLVRWFQIIHSQCPGTGGSPAPREQFRCLPRLSVMLSKSVGGVPAEGPRIPRKFCGRKTKRLSIQEYENISKPASI